MKKLSKEDSKELTSIYREAESAGDIIKANGGISEGISAPELQILRKCIQRLVKMGANYPLYERFTPRRTNGIITLSAFLHHYPDEWRKASTPKTPVPERRAF